MRRVASRTTWTVVVLQHFVYLFVLQSRSGRALAAVGLIAAAALLFARSTRFRCDWAPWAILSTFLLPAASLVRVPLIAFVSLDGRLWLIAAWLFAAAMLLPAPDERRAWAAKLPLVFTVIWSSLFWLAVVSDLGVGWFMMSTNRTELKNCQIDPLAIAFNIWETHPPSEHLFLGWRTYESLQEHRPYANHVHPYLFAMYAWTRLIRAAAHVPLFVATNTVPVFYLVVLVAAVFTLLYRSGLLREALTPMRLAALFMGCGFLVTSSRFWNDMFRYSSDNPYPLLAGVLIFLAAGLVEPRRPWMVLLGTTVLVALSPIHTPMIIAALACLFWFPRRTDAAVGTGNALLARAMALALVTGAIVYAIPWLLSRWRGYVPVGSPFLFRAGLDGDTRYFTNMIQAVFSPCPAGCCWARPATDLLFPAFVPLVIFMALRGKRMWRSTIGLTRLLLFLLAPYLFSLVLFPQSLSVHPYMYDHMLIVPIIVVGIVVMFEWVEDRASDPGAVALGLMLAGGAAIMSNLIGIAQALSQMPVR